MGKHLMTNPQHSRAKSAARVSLKAISALLVIILIIVIALCAAMWVLARGPSPTAQRLFVLTVKETSAMGFLANMYLSEAELDRIIGLPEQDEEFYDVDSSLITLPAPRPPQPAAYLLDDAPEESMRDDEGLGDEIEMHNVVGSGYLGYMMVVRDPMRVFVGTPNNLGGRGMTLMDIVRNTDATAGINGGGFDDPGGGGSGGIPDGIIIIDGQLRWGSGSGNVSVIGFDADGILHVGTMTPRAAMDLNLQWAVSFGPTLISNGTAHNMSPSGINPRTAIGQRADGAVLLLVVEGRQIDSLGATFEDLIEIFLDFGAVNAANLDGGSSTLMMLDGEVINRSASVVGPRLLPSAFLVR